MNSPLLDRNTKFEHSYPSVIPSFSNTNTREILVIIGLITILLFLFMLLIQCFMKVRHIYQTSEPKERYKKSSKHQSKYPSYQKLLITDNKPCKCFQYSCLPKFQCINKTPSPYYEQIDERQFNNSISRVYTSNIRVHLLK
jgi:hypothetical protein